jgi:hypothetical protein
LINLLGHDTGAFRLDSTNLNNSFKNLISICDLVAIANLTEHINELELVAITTFSIFTEILGLKLRLSVIIDDLPKEQYLSVSILISVATCFCRGH